MFNKSSKKGARGSAPDLPAFYQESPFLFRETFFALTSSFVRRKLHLLRINSWEFSIRHNPPMRSSHEKQIHISRLRCPLVLRSASGISFAITNGRVMRGNGRLRWMTQQKNSYTIL